MRPGAPGPPAGSLTSEEVGRLAESVRAVLEAAIAAGVLAADQQYRDLYGKPGRTSSTTRCTAGPGWPVRAAAKPSSG